MHHMSQLEKRILGAKRIVGAETNRGRGNESWARKRIVGNQITRQGHE